MYFLVEREHQTRTTKIPAWPVTGWANRVRSPRFSSPLISPQKDFGSFIYFFLFLCIVFFFFFLPLLSFLGFFFSFKKFFVTFFFFLFVKTKLKTYYHIFFLKKIFISSTVVSSTGFLYSVYWTTSNPCFGAKVFNNGNTFGRGYDKGIRPCNMP